MKIYTIFYNTICVKNYNYHFDIELNYNSYMIANVEFKIILQAFFI
jgi:hypothetical protein